MVFWEIDASKTHRQGRKCPKCGAELVQKSNICSKCSHDITKPVNYKIEDGKEVECPGCKVLNRPGTIICTSCGSNITELKMLEPLNLDVLHVASKRKKNG